MAAITLVTGGTPQRAKAVLQDRLRTTLVSRPTEARAALLQTMPCARLPGHRTYDIAQRHCTPHSCLLAPASGYTRRAEALPRARIASGFSRLGRTAVICRYTSSDFRISESSTIRSRHFPRVPRG